MKKRRFVVLAFMLVAAMMIGVGYAVLTGTLRADGIVHVGLDNSNLKVKYTTTDTSAQKNGTNDLTIGSDVKIEYASENTVATITVAENILKTEGDYVTITIPITNYSDGIDAVVLKPTITMQGNATTYLTEDGVEAELENAEADGSVTLKCAETAVSGNADVTNLIITVTLNDVPIDKGITCNFSVALNAQSVESSN